MGPLLTLLLLILPPRIDHTIIVIAHHPLFLAFVGFKAEINDVEAEFIVFDVMYLLDLLTTINPFFLHPSSYCPIVMLLMSNIFVRGWQGHYIRGCKTAEAVCLLRKSELVAG